MGRCWGTIRRLGRCAGEWCLHPSSSNDDGTRTFYIDGDALYAAELLDQEGAPELTQEQFEELTEEMRKAREETEAEEAEKGSA